MEEKVPRKLHGAALLRAVRVARNGGRDGLRKWRRRRLPVTMGTDEPISPALLERSERMMREWAEYAAKRWPEDEAVASPRDDI